MSDRCELRAFHRVEAHCDAEECVYWRAAGHLGVAPEVAGCAVEHFGLLGEQGEEIAAWLLSVKERVEAEANRAEPGDDD